MNRFKLLLKSNVYIFLKKLIMLDGEKSFIVSSTTYYLLISLVPLSTIVYYFLQLFNADKNTGIILFNYLPLLNENSFSISDLFASDIQTIFRTIICLYIASKGFLNYFYYLNNKFNIPHFPYQFVLNRVYVSLLTFGVCLLFGIFLAVKITFFDSLFNNFKLIKNLSQTLGILAIILLFNYFLLKRKIPLSNLLLGSILSTFLIELFSFFLTIYLSNFHTKEQYYGLLTNVIALLIYLYFLTYSLMIGNQLNYMLFKKYISKNNN